MKKIIYERADGGLSVLNPVEGARLAYSIVLADGAVLPQVGTALAQPVDSIARGWPVAGATADWAETEDEFLARIRAKDVPPDATNVTIVDESALPTDRTFRDAWTHSQTNGCRVDMSKAREIRKGQLRASRAAKFAEADVAFLKALEQWLAGQPGVPEAITDAIARKQELRDVTADPGIQAAQTPEALKAILPNALK